ncbi:hypothetical protein ACOME3_005438 [Neoechinorhynchus agilis]
MDNHKRLNNFMSAVDCYLKSEKQNAPRQNDAMNNNFEGERDEIVQQIEADFKHLKRSMNPFEVRQSETCSESSTFPSAWDRISARYSFSPMKQPSRTLKLLQMTEDTPRTSSDPFENYLMDCQIEQNKKTHRYIEKIFDEIDVNRDGKISIGELKDFVESTKGQWLHSLIDISVFLLSGCEEMNSKDFLDFVLRRKPTVGMKIQNAFDQLDVDKSGKIGINELCAATNCEGDRLGRRKIGLMIESVDGDCDDKIDVLEFGRLVTGQEPRWNL